MRIEKCFIQPGLLLLFLVLIGGCHSSSKFSQTFVSEDHPERSLTLESQVGLIRPAANFPHNLLFRLFGTRETSGTYVLTTGQETIRGTFTAGTDGQTEWIKFISEDKKEWQVKALGGNLVDSDNSVWQIRNVKMDKALGPRLHSWN